jgi:hypothetical protein
VEYTEYFATNPRGLIALTSGFSWLNCWLNGVLARQNLTPIRPQFLSTRHHAVKIMSSRHQKKAQSIVE